MKKLKTFYSYVILIQSYSQFGLIIPIEKKPTTSIEMYIMRSVLKEVNKQGVGLGTGNSSPA